MGNRGTGRGLMKRSKTILGLVALLSAAFWAEAEPRILGAGDSWAASVWFTRALHEVLQEYGIDDVETVGDGTAIGGSTAAQWASTDFKNVVALELAAHPTLDCVHLIAGGNDVLGRIKQTNVYAGWEQFFRESWWDELRNDIQDFVNYCLFFPQIEHVVIGGYDYLNRTTIEVFFSLAGQSYNFGGMSQRQVNDCFTDVGQRKLNVALSTPGCEYVHNFGLLQSHFNWPAGAPGPVGYPTYSNFPGGNRDFPMPDAAFDPIDVLGSGSGSLASTRWKFTKQGVFG